MITAADLINDPRLVGGAMKVRMNVVIKTSYLVDADDPKIQAAYQTDDPLVMEKVDMDNPPEVILGHCMEQDELVKMTITAMPA